MTDDAADADAGWSSITDDEPAELFEIDDLGLMDEVTHPMRGKVMRRLKQPHSVAELAELLDVPVTRLYHHINLLEEHGLIRVVATRRVGAATERRYQVTATSFTIAHHLLNDPDSRALAKAMTALFDVAKLGMQNMVEGGGLRNVEQENHSLLSLAEVRLTPERRAELLHRLHGLAKEFTSEDEGEPVTMFFAVYPEH
jgi:DNA-binding transcriptional ArsR family regulator